MSAAGTASRVYGPSALPTKLELMGVRFVEGDPSGEGAGGGNDNPPQDPPPADPPKTDPPKQDPPKADPPKQDPPKEDKPKVNYREDPDAYVRDLRAENAEKRNEVKALNTTVDSVTKERDALTTEVATLKSERAVYLNASKYGVDASTLLDSREQVAKLSKVDVENAEALKTFFEDAAKVPKFRSGPVLPQSNGGGHQGNGNPPKSTGLAGAVAAAMTP